jgi:Flp pilus assembly protein TadB
LDSLIEDAQPVSASPERPYPAMASRQNQLTAEPTKAQIAHRIQRIQSLLATPSVAIDKQPRPKPKPKKQLRLGNRIRESLGVPLREELNWWQRISWKLKASVIVILIALLFAILHVTILAIIFGVVGAFLLLSGLRRSFKTRRPWF